MKMLQHHNQYHSRRLYPQIPLPEKMNLWGHFHTGLWRQIPLLEKAEGLGDYDMRLRRILAHHISILGWWSSVNAVAGLLAFFFYGTFWYFFLMMSLIWGIINFVITVMVIKHGFIRRFKTGTVLQRVEAQWHIEKIMLLNVGLDLSYIFFGMFLMSEGFNVLPIKAEMYAALGLNMCLQGLFLFGMDNYIHLLHIKNYKKAKPFFHKKLREKT
jgi:hypothetical protein